MEKFLHISPGRCSASKIGYDVDTAKLDQLAFDARFASMRATERGVVTGVPGSERQGYDATIFAPHSVNVYFSRSYPQPPTVVFGYRVLSGGNNHILYAASTFYATGWGRPYFNDATFAWIVVSTSGFTIFNNIRGGNIFNQDPYGTGYYQYHIDGFSEAGGDPYGVYNNFHWMALA